jgi:hypothetical protein
MTLKPGEIPPNAHMENPADPVVLTAAPRRRQWTGNMIEDAYQDALFRLGIVDHWTRLAEGEKAREALNHLRERLDRMEAEIIDQIARKQERQP